MLGLVVAIGVRNIGSKDQADRIANRWNCMESIVIVDQRRCVVVVACGDVEEVGAREGAE
jgi:aspartyl aminopeptidase